MSWMTAKKQVTSHLSPEEMPDEAIVHIPPRSTAKRILYCLVTLLLMVLLLGSYVFIASPSAIRTPQLDHYHFRMQIIVDGHAENFADSRYQIGYSKDQCTVALPTQPIHFHDNKDQFVHIHWQNVTGGMVLKYYGWNYIGGMPGVLGYRFDTTVPQKVPIHGNILPTVPSGANFYIYSGDEHGYTERNFKDFENQKLEQFFGVTSNFPGRSLPPSSMLDKLFPKVSAHEVSSSTSPTIGNETQEEKLTRINNLIGNVVIFVQKDRPTDQQVQDRFNHLEPLSTSTCGG
jgi:hypothetical protein